MKKKYIKWQIVALTFGFTFFMQKEVTAVSFESKNKIENINYYGRIPYQSDTTKVKISKNPVNSPSFVETTEEMNQRLKIKTIYDDLMAFYDGQSNAVINGDANQYDVIPGFVEDPNTGVRTYTIGQYKPLFKEYMLKWWSFYKAIAQRPDPFSANYDNQIAELGALVLSSNRQISHSPHQPQDMANDTYQLGKTGCAQSNLFAAGSKYWFHKTVQFNFTEGKTKDDGAVQIPSLVSMGHRWNGLWKTAASAGFGYNHFNNYTAALYRVVYNANGSDGFQGFSAFPHGYYPVQAELEVKNQFESENLFNKQYPQGAKGDLFNTVNNGAGYHNLWTIQQISTYTINSGQPITVTIRDVNDQGAILDQITCNAGDEVNNANGSFLRIKSTPYAGGWTFTIKPSHGIISNAFTQVLNSENGKAFHITLSGPGISPNQGSAPNLTYRIIYYDIDTYGSSLGTSSYDVDGNLFSLFPNPAKESINIKSNETIKKVEVYNILGQVMIESNSAKNKIITSSLPNGVYLMKVHSTNGKIGVRRFVKN